MTRAAEMLGLSAPMWDLIERLRRDGDRVFGSRRIQILPLTYEIRESSEVTRARVITPTGDRFVFAKILKPKGDGQTRLDEARARLRRDFQITRSVFEAMIATADLRAVEPLACYEDLLGVVTKEAHGTPLDVLISTTARWPGSESRLGALDLALGRIGRWTAVFQQVAPDAATSPLSLEATREYIDARLQKLTRLPRAGFDEADRRAVLALVDRRAADVPSSERFDVPVHGDVTPSNIVVSDQSVTLLDFAMSARGSRYLDVARLHTQLEFYTAKPQYRPQVIARLQRATLDGFEPGLRPDNPLFEIAAVQHIVCHLLSHARQPGRFPASVYSSHQCRRHRRWLRDRARTAKPSQSAPAAASDSHQ